MRATQIAMLAALAAVPAIVTSCGQDYSTPEGLVKGQIKILKNLTEAANSCTKGDVSPLEKALKGMIEEQKKIAAAYKAMSPEQKAECDKLGESGALKEETTATFSALEQAFTKLVENGGMEGLKKLQPLFEEWEKVLSECGK